MIKTLSTFIAITVFVATSAMSAPQKAPEWEVSEWINGEGVSLVSLKGKVVIVEFFQLWCPGCNSFSIPLMNKWHKTFSNEIDSGKLAMLSIHTVFEGHGYQNPDKLKKFVKEKGIKHLVGIDAYKSGDKIPETMKKYRTGGTPSIAIIDKKGDIRFQKLGGFDDSVVEKFIHQLLKEPFEPVDKNSNEARALHRRITT